MKPGDFFVPNDPSDWFWENFLILTIPSLSFTGARAEIYVKTKKQCFRVEYSISSIQSLINAGSWIKFKPDEDSE